MDDASRLLPEVGMTVAVGFIVALLALIRPTVVRDYSNRHLPPNPTARLMYLGLCLFAYLVLVVGLHLFGEFAIQLSDKLQHLALIGSFIGQFQGQAPIMAVVLLGLLFQLSIFREFDRALLTWLHSAGHLHQDGQTLAGHLIRCEFSPSEDEKRSYREYARRFGVYVTSDFDTVGVVTFQSWRKVASLLKLVREWNPEGGDTMPAEDMRRLDELETAHERKTQLAMTILKLVERAERGEPSSKSVSELLSLLARSRPADPTGLDDIETQARNILTSNQVTPDSPLRLTGEEFRAFLAQIESYFHVEYEILLEDIAQLAARSVVLSGDTAADRLQMLRQLGFGGLGVIEPINFNRFIWIFMLVFIGGFLLLLSTRSSTTVGNTPPPADMLARFAFVMSLAALVGAFAGSKRSLSGTAQTPWGAYVVAGLVAVGIYLAVNVMFDLAKHANAATSATAVSEQAAASATPAPQQLYPTLPIQRRLPWCVLPFFLVVALCRLARIEEWPGLPKAGLQGRLLERLVDGLVVAFTMMVAFYLAMGIHQIVGLELPPSVQAGLSQKGMFAFVLTSPIIIFGFLIGFFVVRDVRRAAHARIVAAPLRSGKVEIIPPAKALASRI